MPKTLAEIVTEFVFPPLLAAACYVILAIVHCAEPWNVLIALTILYLWFLGGETASARFFRLREKAYLPLTELFGFCYRVFVLSLLTITFGAVACFAAYWYFPMESSLPSVLLGTTTAISFYLLGLYFITPLDRTIRGRRILTLEEAQAVAEKVRPPDDPGLLFGGVRLPSEAANKGWAIIGASGSGKSMTLQMLCQEALAQIGKPTSSLSRRALVYDPKTVILSQLAGIGIPKKRIKILNPFDARCVAPDFQANIDTPAAALQFATLLIEEEKGGHNRFFSDAARDLLTGVLRAFIKTAPKWDLRDVVLAMQSAKWIWQLTQRLPETKHLAEYFKEHRTWANIHTTIKSHLGKFEPVAALYHGRETVSLDSWLKGQECLVLGNHEALRAAVDPINKLIVKRVIEELLAQTEVENKQTWIVLDELRDMGQLDGLHSLLLKGREKNVCTVLVVHDTEGLHAVYTKPVAEEILSQCNHKAVLLVQTPGTAKWASELLGEVETIEERKNERKHDLVKAQSALPSQFLSLKMTNPENGLTGYYMSPYVGAWSATLSGDYIDRTLLPRDRDKLPDLEKRDKKEQELLPWTEADVSRLKLDPNIEPPMFSQPSPTEPPPSAPSPAATPPAAPLTDNSPQVVPKRRTGP
jgi:hypothetical protein